MYIMQKEVQPVPVHRYPMRDRELNVHVRARIGTPTTGSQYGIGSLPKYMYAYETLIPGRIGVESHNITLYGKMF